MNNIFTIIFSVRKKNNPTYSLPIFLDSFLQHTNTEERKHSEILIKIDEDDGGISSDVSEFASNINIKTFSWARHGGRHSLHENQFYLYKYKNPLSAWIQVMADDFIFTRSNFITEILNIQSKYQILGTKLTEKLCHGCAPCFSRSVADSLCGMFGGNANADGFVFFLEKILKKEYNINNLVIDIEPYYQRTQCGHTGENKSDPFNKMTQHKTDIIFEQQARNLYLSMLDFENDLPTKPIKSRSYLAYVKRTITKLYNNE